MVLETIQNGRSKSAIKLVQLSHYVKIEWGKKGPLEIGTGFPWKIEQNWAEIVWSWVAG